MAGECCSERSLKVDRVGPDEPDRFAATSEGDGDFDGLLLIERYGEKGVTKRVPLTKSSAVLSVFLSQNAQSQVGLWRAVPAWRPT